MSNMRCEAGRPTSMSIVALEMVTGIMLTRDCVVSSSEAPFHYQPVLS